MKKPFYTRIALLGIAMYLSIEVIILVLTLAFLKPADVWYPLLVGGLALVAGAAIYFWHPWGLIVGIAGGIFSIPFSLDTIGENLSAPDSFLDFAYRPIIWGGGTILVLAGSAVGLVQHFRRRTSMHGPVPVVRAAQGLIAVVAAVSLVSAVLTVAGIDHVSAGERTDATVVKIESWHFSSDTVTVASGGAAKLVIENNDPNIHTFTVDVLGLDERLGPFDDALIAFDTAPPGRYEFRCRITGHDAMHGTLVVE